MKILVLYPHPVEPDGQSLQGYYLSKGLRELGYEVWECDRADNIQKLWAYKGFNPDVVIGIGCWSDSPDVIFSPMRHGLKAVPWFNADGWVANYHDTFNNLPLILTTSNWVKETYNRDGVNNPNIFPCSIGFDPKVFYPIPRSDPRIIKLRQLLGIQPDEKMILTAGGDVTSKGAQEMFKALSKITNSFPGWKYVLKTYESFSAEDHGNEEEALIEKLGLPQDRIIYLSGKYSSEFTNILMNACDVYAGPSRLEGFGMFQLEAQACGKPVISIKSGGPRDFILNGETGFLVDAEHEVKLDSEWAYEWMGFEEKHKVVFDNPKTFAYRANIDQLAQATLKLLTDNNLREVMGKSAAKHALENFHYKVTAKKIVELVERYVLDKEKEISEFREPKSF
ncbi:MAG: glycosyltransferase family 4 protein [Candidatus Nanoarchaeia archaeon]